MFKTRDYWAEETLLYSEPHFRLIKSARIFNKLSRGRESELLDVGCGPGTLNALLGDNFSYYGIDICIQDPAPNLAEFDVAERPIEFEDKKFDFVAAFGFFEYMGELQQKKMKEIRQNLKPTGKFVTSFVNFEHRDIGASIHPAYNNIVPLGEFAKDLGEFFHIDRCFPTSHNWHASEPRRDWLMKLQLPLEPSIPAVSPLLAVEYFFICSAA
jgi:SAM-dependent methyltransferase